MIEKLLSAEHLTHTAARTHVLRQKKKEQGKTELVMLFSGPQGSEQLAETIWKTLETAYFETLSQEDAYDRFEEALRIVNLQLAAENELKNQDFLHEYAVLLALFAENELHVSVVGAAEAY